MLYVLEKPRFKDFKQLAQIRTGKKGLSQSLNPKESDSRVLIELDYTDLIPAKSPWDTRYIFTNIL